MRHAGLGGRRQEGDDYRSDRHHAGRQTRAGRVARGRRPAVRLLPVGPDHERHCAAHVHAQSDRCADRCRDGRQHLPLRYLSPHSRGDSQSRERSLTMGAIKNVSRRRFMQASGGLVIGFSLPLKGAFAATEPSAINAWVRVAPNNEVTILCARSEMGQGVVMAMPTLVAEELEVDIYKVKVDFAPPGEAYINGMLGGQITGGSTSVRDGYDRLRVAGAQARTMLVQAAADKWKVDPAECHAKNGFVFYKDKKASYGSLAAAAAQLTPPKDVKLKDPKDFRYVGKPMHRLDTASKVNGSVKFGIDT